jgi:hypothetical protein
MVRRPAFWRGSRLHREIPEGEPLQVATADGIPPIHSKCAGEWAADLNIIRLHDVSSVRTAKQYSGSLSEVPLFAGARSRMWASGQEMRPMGESRESIINSEYCTFSRLDGTFFQTICLLPTIPGD